MRLLSPILRQVVYPVLGKLGYFHSCTSASVLTYHGVFPSGYRIADPFLDDTLLTAEVFRLQLRLLKRHYNVISPEHFRQCLGGSEPLPERAVLLTCDDGLMNNLTVMAPILQEEGLQCLFFITGASVTGHSRVLWYVDLYLMIMDRERQLRGFTWRGIRVPQALPDPAKRRLQYFELMNHLSGLSFEERAGFLQEAARQWGLAESWNVRYLDDPSCRQRFQFLDRDGLRRLSNHGMTVGAHTLSHPALSQLPKALACSEITESKRQLESCIGQAVWALAYPFGNAVTVGDRERDLAREAGYECAFMNVPGTLRQDCAFSIPRVHVTSGMSLGTFEAHVCGFHESLRRRMRMLGSAESATPL